MAAGSVHVIVDSSLAFQFRFDRKYSFEDVAIFIRRRVCLKLLSHVVIFAACEQNQRQIYLWDGKYPDISIRVGRFAFQYTAFKGVLHE